MELVEGADLAGPLPLGTALDYVRQIAAGLEAAHEKGVIHHDLKPANIKVTPEGTGTVGRRPTGRRSRRLTLQVPAKWRIISSQRALWRQKQLLRFWAGGRY